MQNDVPKKGIFLMEILPRNFFFSERHIGPEPNFLDPTSQNFVVILQNFCKD